MYQKFKKYVFALTVVSAAVFGLFFLQRGLGSSAGNPTYWITVDENEIKHIQSSMQNRGEQFGFDVAERRGGIAIIKSDELQILELSRNMHQDFHKCSGFMTFDSYEKAVASADETLRAEPSAQLVTYTIDNQAVVAPMVAEVQPANILNTITRLSTDFPNRRYNQQSGLNSATYIKNQWAALAADRSDISVEFFTHTASVSPQPSVIMTVQGTTFPNEIVVVGGHQDSINTSSQTANAPGADDDASGIASITETIRAMIAKNFRPQRTVKFMAYAAEEVGLRGSNDIATVYKNQNANVIGVMQLDMTNYKGSAVDIVLINDYTNAAQNQFVANLAAAYQPTLTVTNDAANGRCGYACSDHASWFNKGYATSMPFEARFASGVSEDNPYIHTANDTLAQSQNNAVHAAKFSKLAVSFIGELAKGSTVIADPVRTRFDYDGDGKADISVFRPDNGTWYLNRTTAGFTAAAFGANGDKIVPADYDGDGKTDIAVFRAGNWYVLQSSNNQFRGVSFGAAGDVPQTGDFDGDGKADFAVFRPSNGTWYQLNSTAGFAAVNFGSSSDKPLAADYDGDGKTDIAVFRDGNWYIQQSQAGFKAVGFGTSTDQPLAADFDGDRKADLAVFRSGTWYLLRSSAGFTGVSFGTANDKPVAADYDGDGKDDIAVFRPANGIWYISNSSNGSFGAVGFGSATDVPTPQQ